MNNDSPTPPRSPQQTAATTTQPKIESKSFEIKVDCPPRTVNITVEHELQTKEELDFYIEDLIGMSKERFESLSREDQLRIVDEKIIKPSTIDPSLH
jgi:hypothetical protein